MKRFGRVAMVGLGLLGAGALLACNQNKDAVGPERAPIYDAPDEVNQRGPDTANQLAPVTPLPSTQLGGSGTGLSGNVGGSGLALEDEGPGASAGADGGVSSLGTMGATGNVSGATDGGGLSNYDPYGTGMEGTDDEWPQGTRSGPGPNASGAGSMSTGSAGTRGTTPATGGSGATGLDSPTGADSFDAQDGVQASPPARDGGM